MSSHAMDLTVWCLCEIFFFFIMWNNYRKQLTRDSTFSCWGHKDSVLRWLSDGNTDARSSSMTYLISSKRSSLGQIHTHCTLTMVQVLTKITKLFTHSAIHSHTEVCFPIFNDNHKLRMQRSVWKPVRNLKNRKCKQSFSRNSAQLHRQSESSSPSFCHIFAKHFQILLLPHYARNLQ